MTDIQPILYLACGPSGSGKSTIAAKLQQHLDMNYFSWDALRLEWYNPDDYADAHEQSCRDKSFKTRLKYAFQNVLKEQKTLYIDNTNLTKKRRKEYIEAGKKFGYTVIGITFDVSLDTLIARQTIRGDKCVPEAVVIQQFKCYQYPTILEGFDSIVAATSIKGQ